jgi:hypothetical protein
METGSTTDSEGAASLTPEQAVEIALGAAMPLRPSVRSLAQVVLGALRESGYYVACNDCNSSVSGIHYVNCSTQAKASTDEP